jgi:RNA polymerase sigma factor (sigma-70 family)
MSDRAKAANLSGKRIGSLTRYTSMASMEADFEAFYESAKDPCLRALWVATGDLHLAEDLCSEAFARAWSRWPAVARHPSPQAWVLRTALNLKVSWWRRHRREDLVGSDSDVASLVVDDVAGASEVVELVRGLPRRQREVVAMRMFLDMDTRTTSEALGIAEGTVTAHLSRAVSTLREQLMLNSAVGGRHE